MLLPVGFAITAKYIRRFKLRAIHEGSIRSTEAELVLVQAQQDAAADPMGL
jgi:hypothetical protein